MSQNSRPSRKCKVLPNKCIASPSTCYAFLSFYFNIYSITYRQDLSSLLVSDDMGTLGPVFCLF